MRGYLSSKTIYSFIKKKSRGFDFQLGHPSSRNVACVRPSLGEKWLPGISFERGVGSKSGRVLVLTTLPPSRVNCL